MVVTEEGAHFHVKKTKGVPVQPMQKIDLGIALCHFALTAEELGIDIAFSLNDPKLGGDVEYIASYLLK